MKKMKNYYIKNSWYKMFYVLVGVLFITVLYFGNTKAATSGNFGFNDEFKWVLDSEGTLTISGKGKLPGFVTQHLPDSTGEKPPWYSEREKIKKIVVKEGTEYLGCFQFYACKNLTEVILPDSLTGISQGVFQECSKLKTITFPKNVNSLEPCLFGPTGPTVLRFTGNAPKIADNSFGSITATVYYPKNNSSWNGSVFNDYSGNITWVEYELPETITKVKTTTQNKTVTSKASNNQTIRLKKTKLKKLHSKKKRTVFASWKKRTGITGYQLQFSNNKKFKKRVYKRQYKRRTSVKIIGLKSKKVYYFRIRCYKKTKNKTIKISAWSRIKKVKIK